MAPSRKTNSVRPAREVNPPEMGRTVPVVRVGWMARVGICSNEFIDLRMSAGAREQGGSGARRAPRQGATVSAASANDRALRPGAGEPQAGYGSCGRMCCQVAPPSLVVYRSVL